MKLLGLWAFWLLCYFGPQYVPADIYDPHFHTFGAIISLSLLWVTLHVTKDSREWWRAEIATVYTLSLFHFLGDFIFDYPARNFDQIAGALNFTEAAILFGAGGGTWLYEFCHRRNAAKPDRGGGSHGSQGRAQGRESRA